MAASFLMQLEDFEQAQTWIDASAAQGAGNRYEILARANYYLNQAQWSKLKTYAETLPTSGADQLSHVFALGDAELGLGNFAAAESVYRTGLDYMKFDVSKPTTGFVVAFFARQLAYALQKQAKPEAEQVLKSVAAGFDQQVRPYMDASNIGLRTAALIASMSGDVDACIGYLQTMLDRGLLNIPLLRHRPLLENCRADPRFADILAGMENEAEIELARLVELKFSNVHPREFVNMEF